MSNIEIPFWERYILTIEEASEYFRIGENKLRKLVNENKSGLDFVIWNGNRALIKRKMFERFLDNQNAI